MHKELFTLPLKTFNTIWGTTKTCDDSDNTFEIVRLGNTMRNRIYRLINKKIISSNCFSDNDCSLDEEVECNIFDFVDKGSNSLNITAYLEHVNNTIFRVVNSFDHTQISGPEYKIFSPDNTPLLYEHQCFTRESILIKNVHKMVLQGQDVSIQTPKTGKCGIFLIECMSDKLKQMLQEVIPDLVQNTTSSILDFFSTTATEQTSLNYTNNYGMIDYNSTDISSYDTQHSQDNTMLVNGLVLASALTFTASMTYLLTRMYNKYCKAPIAQLETADTNISDPNLMEINSKKVKIYYSDSSEDGKDYTIVDISNKKAKYKKATYDFSNPSSSHSGDYERMKLMSSTDDANNVNINDQKCTYDTSHPSTHNSHIYETIDKITDQGYATDSSTYDHSHVNAYSLPKLHPQATPHIIRQVNTQSYGNYDSPPYPRPVTVIENKNFHVPVEQYHDDSNLLGLTEFPC